MTFNHPKIKEGMVLVGQWHPDDPCPHPLEYVYPADDSYFKCYLCWTTGYINELLNQCWPCGLTKLTLPEMREHDREVHPNRIGIHTKE